MDISTILHGNFTFLQDPIKRRLSVSKDVTYLGESFATARKMACTLCHCIDVYCSRIGSEMHLEISSAGGPGAFYFVDTV